MGRVGAQSREDCGVDLAVTEGKADFQCPSELTDVDGVLQADAA